MSISDDTDPKARLPRWSTGIPKSEFSHWRDRLKGYMVHKGYGYVLFDGEVEQVAPAGAGSVDKKKGHRSKAFEAIRQAIPDEDWPTIHHDADYEFTAAEEAAAGFVDPRIGHDVTKLWNSITAYAAGGDLEELAGPSLIEDAATWEWPSHAGNMQDQVKTAMADLLDLRRRAVQLNDPDYSLRQPYLAAIFRAKMPQEVFDEPRYRSFNQFHILRANAMRDAMRYDAKHKSTGAPPKALAAQGIATRVARRARQLDKSAGPPNPGMKWCDMHGWNYSHNTSSCRGGRRGRSGKADDSRRGPPKGRPCKICGSTKHWARDCPQASPSDRRTLDEKALVAKYGSSSKSSQEDLYRKNDDGTFARVLICPRCPPTVPTSGPQFSSDNAGDGPFSERALPYEQCKTPHPATTASFIAPNGIDASVFDHKEAYETPNAASMFEACIDEFLSKHQPQLACIERIMSEPSGKTTEECELPAPPKARRGAMITPPRAIGAKSRRRSSDHTDDRAKSAAVAAGVLGLVLAGKSLPPDDKIYVDTGADFSISNDVNQFVPGSFTEAVGPSSVGGVSGQAQIKGKGDRIARLRYGENVVYYRDVNVMYIPGSAHNVVATERLAAAGISTCVDASKPGNPLLLQLPAGVRTNVPSLGASTMPAVSTVRVGNLWALPVLSFSPSQPFEDALVSVCCEAPKRALPAVATDADYVDVPPPPPLPPTASSWPQPTDYTMFRATMGAAGHRKVSSAASYFDARLSNAKNPALDRRIREANQSSQPLRSVPSVATVDDAQHVLSDTLGGKFPDSAAGNRYCQVWAVDSDRLPYVTFASDHSSSSSIRGFKQFVLDSGLRFEDRVSVRQPVVVWVDGGTEYAGGFRDFCWGHGVDIRVSSPARKNTARTGFTEQINQLLQRTYRNMVALAESNFRSFGLDASKYWDYGFRHAALITRWSPTTSSNGRPQIAEVHGDVTLDQFRRALPCPYGAIGNVTLQKSQRNGIKQFAARSAQALLLGIDRSDRYVMLERDGSIRHTIDVSFDHSTCMTGHVFNTAPAGPVKTELASSTPSHAPTIAPPPPMTTSTVTNPTSVAEAVDDLSSATDVLGVDDTLPQPLPPAESWFGASHEYEVHDGDLVVTALIAKRNFTPHPTVRQYFNNGELLDGLLDGTIAAPKPPPLPTYLKHQSPPDPGSLYEALSGPEALHWLCGMLDEFHGHLRRPSLNWSPLEDAHNGTRRLNMKWVLTRKWSGTKLARFKARLVLAGWGLERGVDFVESWIGTAPPSDLRMLTAIAVELNYYTWEIDIVMAYVSSPMPKSPPGKQVFARMPQGSRRIDENGRELGVLLKRAVYGHPVSGYAFQQGLFSSLLSENKQRKPCPLKFTQTTAQPAIFVSDSPRVILWTYSDNIRVYAPDEPAFPPLRQWFQSEYEISGGDEPLNVPAPQDCLGVQFEHGSSPRPHAHLTMDAYILKLLQAHGLSSTNPNLQPLPTGFVLTKDDCPSTDDERDEVVAAVGKLLPIHRERVRNYADATKLYKSIVAAVAWFAGMVCPMLKYASSTLGRGMHAPSVKSFKGAKQSLQHCKSQLGVGLLYQQTKVYGLGQLPTFIFGSDASLADDTATCKSQGGYVALIPGQAATHFASMQSSTICLSTLQSETHFASEAAREISCHRALLLELRLLDDSKPTVLQIDNAATVLNNPGTVMRWSSKQKHFSVKEKYFAQEVKAGKIQPVKVDGSTFAADAMTKALARELLGDHASVLTGSKR